MKQSGRILNFFKEHTLFLLILTVSALLRFLPLFEYQFTLDELSGLNRTRFDSFSELIEKGVKIDAHPALLQVLIFWLVKLFGYVNWIVKLPFLVFSLGASVYAYALVYRNYSKQSALIALSIFSFSLVFVFYAPIARMYISGVFFSVGLLYYFFETVFQNSKNKWHFLWLALFALLSALNQHINALFAFTVCASGIFLIQKEQRIVYLLTCVGAILLYLPHLPVTLYQLSLGGIGLEQGGWLEKPNWTIVWDFIKLLFGTWKVYVLILILLIWRFLSEGFPRIQKSQLFLLLIFFLNYWIVYQYSFHQAPVYQHSAMLFSGICVVLFVSSLFEFRNDVKFFANLSMICGALLYTSYIRKDYYGNCVRSVFEEQYRLRAKYTANYGEKEVLSVFFDGDEFMQEIYERKYPSSSELHFGPDPWIASNASLIKGLFESKAEVLIMASPMPLQEEIARQYFPNLLYQNISQGNNIRIYSRSKNPGNTVSSVEKVIFKGSISGADDIRLTIPGKQKVLLKNLNLKLDSLNEFPFSASKNYAELKLKEGNVILLEVKGKLLGNRSEGLEACISINTEKETLHYSAGSIKDGILKDSSFCFYTQLYCGSKHKDWLKKNARIQFFLWNKNKEIYFIESFRLKAIDYWPEKWGFWE